MQPVGRLNRNAGIGYGFVVRVDHNAFKRSDGNGRLLLRGGSESER